MIPMISNQCSNYSKYTIFVYIGATTIWVVADASTKGGFKLIQNAMLYIVRLSLVLFHNRLVPIVYIVPRYAWYSFK